MFLFIVIMGWKDNFSSIKFYSDLVNNIKTSVKNKGRWRPCALPKHRRSLLTIILIRLMVTLVAYCVTKCQEAPIRLAQIWCSVSQVAPEKSCLIKIL